MMRLSRGLRRRSGRHMAALGGVLALAALALGNRAAARRAERDHPPEGQFITVDGVRLHYTDRGTGRPVVLVHGNAVSGHDYDTSGVAGALLRTNRVIVFDRPGFGHSERPHGRSWTAGAQAALLGRALAQLGVERPVLVGHSWGTLVALLLALDGPGEVAGLVLISGYYFPTARLDAALVAPVAVPGLGDLLRWTVSPPLGWLLMPAFKRLLFWPARMTGRFRAEYSAGMALRPSQVRATASDGALMVPGVAGLGGRYAGLGMPVAILAGHGDLVVGNKQARRLHAAVPGSTLQVVEGVGHMLHHVATDAVVAAVADVVRRSWPTVAGPVPEPVPAD